MELETGQVMQHFCQFRESTTNSEPRVLPLVVVRRHCHTCAIGQTNSSTTRSMMN